MIEERREDVARDKQILVLYILRVYMALKIKKDNFNAFKIILLNYFQYNYTKNVYNNGYFNCVIKK